jgi:hypothetical protein
LDGRDSTTKWSNDQTLTSSVLVVKFFYLKLLILSLINKCYNLLVLWIDLYFEFFDICVPKYNLLGRSVLTYLNRTKFGFIYDEDVPDFVLMLNL